MKAAAKRNLFFLCIFTLQACAVGPNYSRPEVSWPQKYKSATSEMQAPLQETAQTFADWWKGFDDPVLNDMIVHALKNNRDLKIAAARVKEARADWKGARADLWPRLDLVGSAGRSHGGLISQGNTVNLFEGSFDASWEVDLFGGKRRRAWAQKSLYEAERENEREVWVSLLAEVARNYIEARKLEQQIRFTEQSIQAYEKTLALLRDRYRSGLISYLEVSQQETAYHTNVSSISRFRANLEASYNRLSTLLGENPGFAEGQMKAGQGIPQASPQWLLSTPAVAVTYRPDVSRAERQLEAATHMTGAAIAEHYPKLNLSGLFGIQQNSFFGAGIIWSIASGFFMPLFDFGRIRAQVQAAEAQQEQALNIYEKTVLEALEEIETSLSSFLNESNRFAALQEARNSSQLAYRLAEERYRKGI